MRTMTTPVSRPRVYLIDFEVAVEFPAELPSAECVCTGLPLGGSFPDPDMYSRLRAPEMTTGKPYNPFKTDVWQLGISFGDFRVCVLPSHVFHLLIFNFCSDHLADDDRGYR
jgi:serine/threonine protein kinase